MDSRLIYFTIFLSVFSLGICQTSTTSETTTTSSTTTISGSEELNKTLAQMRTGAMSKYDTHFASPLASVLGHVFKWADMHYPLAIKILQVTKTMSDTELEQVPGVKIFLEILSEAVHWHLVKEKLPPGKDFSNHTLQNVVEEFSKHHNYSLTDIPFFKNVTDKIMKNPYVKDFVREAMTTSANGLPFAMTLLFLVQHIGTQIPASQWSNHTVQGEVIKNITMAFSPYSKVYFDKKINKFKANAHWTISNLTDFGDQQVRKVGEIAMNVSDNAFGHLKNATSTIVHYSGNAMNRSKILLKLAGNLTQDQYNELVDFLNRTKRLPGQFFESPINGLSHMTNNVLTIATNSFKNVVDFSAWLQKLTWQHFEDLASLGLRARDITFSGINQAGHLGVGVVRHYVGSVKNFTALTMNMTPMQIFKFKSVEDLARKGQEAAQNMESQNKTQGILTSLPIVGSLPGVSVIQALLNKFPELISLSFDKLMDIFDIFRLRNKQQQQ